MRVLHVINGLSTGGAEMSLYRLLGSLNGSEIESAVASLLDVGTVGERIESLGIPVAALNARSVPRGLGSIPRLRALVRGFRPDVIQGWMYHGNLASLVSARVAHWNVPVLWNIRHSVSDLALEKRLTAIVMRMGARLSKRTAAIIYNAHVSARQHEALGFDKSKTRVIPNGIDLEHFRPRNDAAARLRTSLGFPENWVLVGLVARYHPMKGHSDFLRAAGELIERRQNAGFVLAGRGVDRENEPLWEEIRARGIADHVRLLGERADIADIMAGLGIFTSSSRWGEGFPNTVAEAMACEVPCVVTDVGDSALLVGNSGMVVKPGDPGSISKAWSALITEGIEDCRARGRRARLRIEECFGLSSMAQQYARLYQGTLSNA